MERKRQVAGQPIRASSINAGIEARDLLDAIQVSAPLEVSKGSGGLLIRLASALFQVSLGKTTGAIAAGSIATPTAGTVNPLYYNGTGWTARAITYTAYNLFTKTGGIASGKLVVIVKITGQWVIVSADC